MSGLPSSIANQAETLFALNGSRQVINRYIWRPLAAAPCWGPLRSRGCAGLCSFLSSGCGKAFSSKSCFARRGCRSIGGVYRRPAACLALRPLRVLAYHAITDRLEDSIIKAYGIPLDAFKIQLDELGRMGYHFCSGDEFIRFMSGEGGLPRRALLLTFDDGYRDLLASVLPVLAERGIPAITFAVSGHLGETNVWDKKIGAPQLGLLDLGGLKQLVEGGSDRRAFAHTSVFYPSDGRGTGR